MRQKSVQHSMRKSMRTNTANSPLYRYTSEKSAEVPELGIPCYVQLSRTLLNRMKFSVARSRICAANIVPVCIEIKLVDENGGVHFARTVQLKPRLNHSTASFTLPDTLPEDKELFLNVRARLKNSVNAAEKTVPVVFTEESIPE